MHEPQVCASNYFQAHTGFARLFAFEFQYPRFAFTFVTPVTFSLVLFLFPFLLYRLEVPIDISRAHSFLETSSFGGGIRQFFFPFFQPRVPLSFRFVTFCFVSFRLKVPRRAFGGGRFSLTIR